MCQLVSGQLSAIINLTFDSIYLDHSKCLQVKCIFNALRSLYLESHNLSYNIVQVYVIQVN
jgi:hypothetical protein